MVIRSNFIITVLLGAAAAVGAKAGVTRAVQNRIKVSHSPPVYIYDTPGILTPNIPDIESGMRLAVCGEWSSTQSIYKNILLSNLCS